MSDIELESRVQDRIQEADIFHTLVLNIVCPKKANYAVIARLHRQAMTGAFFNFASFRLATKQEKDDEKVFICQCSLFFDIRVLQYPSIFRRR